MVLLAVGTQAGIAASRLDVAQGLAMQHDLRAPVAISSAPAIQCPAPSTDAMPAEFEGSRWRKAQWQQQQQAQKEAKRYCRHNLSHGRPERVHQGRHQRARDWQKRAPILVEVVAGLAAACGSAKRLPVDRHVAGWQPAPRCRCPARGLS